MYNLYKVVLYRTKRDKAKYLGTVPLDFLTLPGTVGSWETYETEDIFATNFVNFPHDYLRTLGSGISPYKNLYTSLATTPDFQLPTTSQLYTAGRTVIRWGGSQDPFQVDLDHYLFTPDFSRGVAVVSLAPKSEPHHITDDPELIVQLPDNLRQLVYKIQKGEYGK